MKLLLTINSTMMTSSINLKMFEKTCLMSKKKLYVHGFDAEKSIFWANPETGKSKNFWLRAMGWYVVAIVDVMSLHAMMKESKLFFQTTLT
jgi:rhamnogalacturonyl hydrolase YesR